ncbi:hypothetical protein J41TS12_30280 [Paenibacillus antibioticophila]|uniref:Transcriptional regulator n=1 Tax=Paenibacillus antibioticophila TaxID=1274374 RepID=A0A919XWZ8_9BACL|nr:Rrf2 family transcriptional regulator [Paenibacillus antibioticophila]GIO38167.1 hypothetical protein J41TS12_30280 [Paenibacillus antibioticophila]
MLAKLVKAGLIKSMSGSNGGTVFDAIGKTSRSWTLFTQSKASLFECGLDHGSECLIQQVVTEAEHQMEQYLKNKKIHELAGQFKEMD